MNTVVGLFTSNSATLNTPPAYQEFFAYELHVKHKVKIDEMLIRDADNLSSESQYKCPLCKSTNWQKV